MTCARSQFIVDPMAKTSERRRGSGKECQDAKSMSDQCKADPELHQHITIIAAHDSDRVLVYHKTDLSQICNARESNKELDDDDSDADSFVLL